jgi:AAA15 family ATPase/GTPase
MELNSMEVNANLITKIGKSGDESWLLKDVRQMTFFIGPNNSGKSRTLRNLFKDKQDSWVFDVDSISIDKVIEVIRDYLQVKPRKLVDSGIQSIDEGKLSTSLLENEEKPNNIQSLIRNVYKNSIKSGHSNSNNESKRFEVLINETLSNHYDGNIKYDLATHLQSAKWKKIYIPTLRGLRHVTDEDVFEKRTKSDYFSKADEIDVFTGHSLYEDLTSHLLGSYDKREKVREYEKYLSENFFFGNDISLVPMVDKDVVHIKEGVDEDRPIYDLGDGIQSVILLTYKVFMAEEPTMFFIEEPEHFLHAGLQRTLIETFAKHKEHMFFMTTHSNHFLDLAQERDDVSIQQVSRVNGESRVQASLDYGELLNGLGVRASSVLLANCSIWVEGVTDKLYLRTYLNKYIEDLEDEAKKSKLKSYHENLHFVFTEYQGSNITHWNFNDDFGSTGSETPAKRLNRNILLIADADIESKGDRVESLKDALGDAFYLLKYKEIENYIPYEILMDTAKARWETFNQRSGSNIDRFKNIKEGAFKSSGDGIGRVLERYVDKNKEVKRMFYSDTSGTIKDKVKFCHKAISLMNESVNWKLTPELTQLCEKVWKFIELHNQ